MIYIATHKLFSSPNLEGYIPIQVGAEGKTDLGFIKDNTGDNISSKNAHYCELTGLYWIWKNVSDEYVGIVHYRRYFSKTELFSSEKYIYRFDELRSFLDSVDIILPEREYYKTNARYAMGDCITNENFEQMRKSVNNLYPEYTIDYDQFFKGNSGSQYNMMFCRKQMLDDYCEWLFNILFDIEQHTDMAKLNSIQQRLYGYLSERLLNIWVMHNHLKVKYVNAVQMEMNPYKKIRVIRRRYTNRIRFAINPNNERY